MADTRTSKIKVRQGNFADLPVLDPGELGYAKDQRRLFIGNDTVTVGTGNGVLTQFTVPLALSNPVITTVFVAGTAVNAVDYSLLGTTLTFATAPVSGAEISVRYLPLTGSATYTNDTATGDGSTTAFTIDSGRTVEDVMVSVNGVLFVPTDDYTISGTTLTFTTAPISSAEISIRYLRQN